MGAVEIPQADSYSSAQQTVRLTQSSTASKTTTYDLVTAYKITLVITAVLATLAIYMIFGPAQAILFFLAVLGGLSFYLAIFSDHPAPQSQTIEPPRTPQILPQSQSTPQSAKGKNSSTNLRPLLPPTPKSLPLNTQQDAMPTRPARGADPFNLGESQNSAAGSAFEESELGESWVRKDFSGNV